MPKISVVIPTYNRAQYIGQCIDSVVAQIGTPDIFTTEILIIDDGSTDNTKDIISEYMKKYKNIRYYLIKNSGGPATPRNKGIAESTGELIAFLDSDDVWLPEKLREQLKALSKPDIMICSTNAKVIGATGSQGRKKYLQPGQGKSGLIFDELVTDNFVITSSVLVRKTVLDEIGGFNTGKDFIAVEDYDLWLRIAIRHKFIYLEEALLNYRQHDGNISTEEAALAIKKVITVLRQQLNDSLSSGHKKIVYSALAQNLGNIANHSRGIKQRVYRLEARISSLRAKGLR